MTTERQAPASLELASALLVPAAVIGFGRVFADLGAVVPALLGALISTLLAALLRRARVPLIIAAVISALALAELMMQRYAPGTLRYGVLPTAETRDTLRALLDLGLQQFRDERAPVDALAPFVAATIIGAWVLAFLTDWAALRLHLAFEPVLPAGLLFIFAAVLGSGDRQMSSTVVFAGAVAIWAISQRGHRITEGVWLTIDRYRGPTSVLRASSIVVVIAIAAGVIVGPRLPGFGSDELLRWRSTTDPTRRVISPYVNLRDRLADQPDTEMFIVEADRPSYWRLAGLDAFEDGVWSTKGDFEVENGRLPGSVAVDGSTITSRQQFEITGMSEIWLPAAYAPSVIRNADATITWNAGISSLTVDNDRENSDGLTYQLDSVIPAFTPDELRAEEPITDADLLERYTALPSDLTPRVASEAQAITAGQTTTFDKMLALQDYFRAFDYSLELPPRRGDPIEQFLDERVGFCQQFSGTFALMARSLGVPARVAVGFTWGDPVAGEPNTYRVTGRHAHAWPEVYFQNRGWVAFEPTPGRGAPDAGYTGVTPTQDSATGSELPTTPTTVPDLGERSPFSIPSEAVPEPDLGDLGGGGTTGGTSSVPWRLVGAVAALAAYGIAMPALLVARRRRRLGRATSPAAHIEAIWANLAEQIDWFLGTSRPDALTRPQWVERLIVDRRLPATELRRLGAVVTEAKFSPPDSVDPAAIEIARRDADAVEDLIHRRVPAWRRWLVMLDPRRLQRR
jgi:transglutaminase-like putative cysteine protease